MKSVALVTEKCQAPKIPTVAGTVMRMVNLLADMESNGPLRLHEPHFFQTALPPGHRAATGGAPQTEGSPRVDVTPLAQAMWSKLREAI